MGVRTGVVGLGTGLFLADRCRRVGMDVVAVCDRDEARRAAARDALPDALSTARWEDLLDPDLGLDAVVLANDFDAHAPLAVSSWSTASTSCRSRRRVRTSRRDGN
ncbi:hypothetical protein ACIP88_16275 [Streptomyces uncialis]|uniref:hypothetical protein n=1 Tax=Streptomyces uncialis TaxID=1048205 RepID=UPI003806E475